MWFQQACEAGNINYIIRRTQTHIQDIKPTLAITLGIKHNQNNIIEYFYDNFRYDIDWNNCAKTICKYGKWDLFDRITASERCSLPFWDNALYGSVSGYKLDRINTLISRGAKGYFAFYGACEGNHMDLVKKYDKIYNVIDYGPGLILASNHKDVLIVSYLLTNYYDQIDKVDLDISLGIACETDNMILLNKVMRYGADDYTLGLSKSCGKFEGMSRLMKVYGAKRCGTCIDNHMKRLSRTQSQ